MSRARLENFTDAVLAILTTILVLDLKAPSFSGSATVGDYFQAFGPLWPKFFSFTLSFVVLAVYWINHHYFFRYVEKVTTKVLWLNILLLFIISFIPFSASLLGSHLDGLFPIVFYATNTLLAATSFYFLRSYVYRNKLYSCNDIDAIKTFGPWKSLPGIIVSLLAIFTAFMSPYVALFFLALYPVIYGVPEKLFR
jgi:uncharacterized membrane protein